MLGAIVRVDDEKIPEAGGAHYRRPLEGVVPFYNLRRLHLILRSMYAELEIRPHTYREIIWQWFVLNRAAHTNWEVPGAESPAPSPAQASGA